MRDGLREWMTAGEIASLKIPGFPHSHNGVHYYAKANSIHLNPELCRKKKGAGGRGVEYHRSIIPVAFDDHMEWLTAQEILDMQIEGLPTRIDELQAKFRREGIEEEPNLFRQFGQGHAFLYHRSVVEDRANWFRPREIAQMHLPGFPAHSTGVTRYMRSVGVFGNDKLCRRSSGPGGGFEYHIDALPPMAKERAKHIRRSEANGPRTRFRLERRPLGRLAETFPTATEIRLDMRRSRDKRLIVRVPAPSRPMKP